MHLWLLGGPSVAASPGACAAAVPLCCMDVMQCSHKSYIRMWHVAPAACSCCCIRMYVLVQVRRLLHL
jgi:hypothetical protein